MATPVSPATSSGEGGTKVVCRVRPRTPAEANHKSCVRVRGCEVRVTDSSPATATASASAQVREYTPPLPPCRTQATRVSPSGCAGGGTWRVVVRWSVRRSVQPRQHQRSGRRSLLKVVSFPSPLRRASEESVGKNAGVRLAAAHAGRRTWRIQRRDPGVRAKWRGQDAHHERARGRRRRGAWHHSAGASFVEARLF